MERWLVRKPFALWKAVVAVWVVLTAVLVAALDFRTPAGAPNGDIWTWLLGVVFAACITIVVWVIATDFHVRLLAREFRSLGASREALLPKAWAALRTPSVGNAVALQTLRALWLCDRGPFQRSKPVELFVPRRYRVPPVCSSCLREDDLRPNRHWTADTRVQYEGRSQVTTTLTTEIELLVCPACQPLLIPASNATFNGPLIACLVCVLVGGLLLIGHATDTVSIGGHGLVVWGLFGALGGLAIATSATHAVFTLPPRAALCDRLAIAPSEIEAKVNDRTRLRTWNARYAELFEKLNETVADAAGHEIQEELPRKPPQ
ncbi:MAG: hypothetical protein WC889_11340 [Myxococcota bacterium]